MSLKYWKYLETWGKMRESSSLKIRIFLQTNRAGFKINGVFLKENNDTLAYRLAFNQ